MKNEAFKPIAIQPPSKNPLMWRVRCLVDLQLCTIEKHLRPAMQELKGRVLDIGAGQSPWKDFLPSS